MNIGIVTTWFERGAAIVSKQFMSVLQSQGHDVFIYGRGGEEFAIGDPNWDLPNVTWNSFLYSNIPTDMDKNQYETWLSINNIDVVLFNEQQYLSPVLWTKSKKIPTIAYVDYYTKDNYKAFEIYEQLWCNTKRHYSAFEWHKGAKYIPWGTDTSIYKRETEDYKYFFFHSSGMSPYRKGTDVFIEALWHQRFELQTMNRNALIHTQVGLEYSFPILKDKIIELIDLGVLKVVEKTITAPGLYGDAKVYVYPSRLEGIGLTLAEAACSGLYIITTDEAPMSEFCIEDQSLLIPVSRYFERKDRYYWDMVEPDANALSELLLSDVPRSSSVKNSTKARQKFDFNSNAKILSEHIETIRHNETSPEMKTLVNYHDKNIGIFFNKRNRFNRTLFSILKRIKKSW